MIVPQPFQYQGSKRTLAPLILQYLPISTTRLVEPFSGSAALSIATAARGRAKEFWLNDFNAPLAQLLSLIINSPKELGRFYKELWRADHEDALEHYYQVRESFNRTKDPQLLLYLLARCVKGAVRYNGEGLFNQSPDKRRLGTQPETMQSNLNAVSTLLRGKSIVTSLGYENVLANVREDDVVYMDPPYQGVCGERDSRYFAGISFDEFVAQLAVLNLKNVRYLVSYDGRLGNRSYGKPLPAKLHLTLMELEAGRSSQATLLGRDEQTVESLYLSPGLAEELEVRPATHRYRRAEQMQLMEKPVPYGKTKIPKKEFLELCASVTGKRPKTVIDHVLKHGHITTEELKNKYGYDHPPRAARDVRELGIELETFRVEAANGRKIAAYRFADPSKKQFRRFSGRTGLSKKIKDQLIEKYGCQCFIYLEKMDAPNLQIDHRIPYEVAGEADELNTDDFMLLCGSANRAKSWSCEHCENWKTVKDKSVCLSCYWAYPEKYNHVAMRLIRRVDLVWQGEEIAQYHKLKSDAAKSGLEIPQFVKVVLAKVLK